MKIFFFTTMFAPSVGGIEKLAEVLCKQFVKMGREVRLATMTQGEGEFSFPVIRRPSILEFWKLLGWCDVHVQANVTLKYAWPRFTTPHKMLYQHNNPYLRDDATRSLRDHLKVLISSRTNGIANSYYTAQRTGVDNVVLNAYDDAVFRASRPWAERDKELVFLGRLVSQKGCDTLLKALGRLRAKGVEPRLTIIGDGPERSNLEALSESLGLSRQVSFVGQAQGDNLAAILNEHRVIVVPSSYEEAFGIVALEGMACGCVPIVSERGGLVDAVAGHGLTFPNGDDFALAQVLAETLRSPESTRARLKGVESHLARCTAH